VVRGPDLLWGGNVKHSARQRVSSPSLVLCEPNALCA
jgi:hypothetical protein